VGVRIWRSLLGIGAAVGGGYAAARLLRDPKPVAGRPISGFGRAQRAATVARLGAGVGVDVASNSARKMFASAERREALDRELELRTAEQVAGALGNMKGALMKIGQMASFVDDGLPQPIRDALATLQQDAPPMSAALAAQVIEEELGAPPEKVFAEWDPVPIAAASIGQVHRAMTHDGRAVAVKVQYPGVNDAIRADLDNTGLLVQVISMVFPGLDPGPLVAELRARLLEELDYRLEADNQKLFADFYRDHPFIVVPDVDDELSTGRVLTSTLSSGERFSEVLTWSQRDKDLAAETIYRFVFRSLYRLNAFNGDPHPGNYLFHGEGRVTFLDFGLVKRFTPLEIDLFADLIKALVLNRDLAEYRRLLEAAGSLKPNAPMTDEEVAEYVGYFYEPVLHDEPWTVTHEYSAKALGYYFNTHATHPGMASHGNVPPMMVIIQRINFGLMSVLAELNATANWRKIAEELWPFVDAPPSTPLGQAEAAWLATRAGARSG